MQRFTINRLLRRIHYDFATRKSAHKHNSGNERAKDHQLPLYQHIKHHSGWNNFDMILIETRSCLNRLEACKIEREHVEQRRAMLHCKRPVVSKQRIAGI